MELTSEATLERLLQEIDRLTLYANQGDLEPQPLPPATYKASEQIRGHITHQATKKS